MKACFLPVVSPIFEELKYPMGASNPLVVVKFPVQNPGETAFDHGISVCVLKPRTPFLPAR